ncbi:peptidase S8/S53 domain-containing protein [Tribonema minus]|uniref:subtilisin n=1 Tax=Tribonema minus TaxID=303371 RepID=A0A835ZDG2_9STRA|nr:peptidase S8/S53 domain-containing protein [Tribonema minus]
MYSAVALGLLFLQGATTCSAKVILDQYIVTLADDCDRRQLIDHLAPYPAHTFAHSLALRAASNQAAATKVLFVYSGLNGFAVGGVSDVQRLREEPCVVAVEEDREVALPRFQGGAAPSRGLRGLKQPAQVLQPGSRWVLQEHGPTACNNSMVPNTPSPDHENDACNHSAARAHEFILPLTTHARNPLQAQVLQPGIRWVLQEHDPAACNGTAWVLDTGIDGAHPDLFVDKKRSKSFLGNNDSWQDEMGHGTHVAGVIAAKENAIGVVGVCPGATLVAVRVLDAKGVGTVSGVLAGLDYVRVNGKAGDVANLSLGGAPSASLDAALLKAAARRGVRFAVAAGNDGGSAGAGSPARAGGASATDAVFTVAAVAVSGTSTLKVDAAPFSNYDTASCKVTLSIIACHTATALSMHSTKPQRAVRRVHSAPFE